MHSVVTIYSASIESNYVAGFSILTSISSDTTARNSSTFIPNVVVPKATFKTFPEPRAQAQ